MVGGRQNKYRQKRYSDKRQKVSNKKGKVGSKAKKAKYFCARSHRANLSGRDGLIVGFAWKTDCV